MISNDNIDKNYLSRLSGSLPLFSRYLTAKKNPSKAFQPPRVGGGAKGIRTPDLYNANVARYQLCYSPLFGNFSDHILHLVGFRCLRGGSAQVVVRSTNCANAP